MFATILSLSIDEIRELPFMKRHRLFTSVVIIFLVVFGAAFIWMRTALWPRLPQMITSLADEKINGTLTFSDMHVSLTGKVVFTDVAVTDAQGRRVLDSEEVDVTINPFKAVVSSLSSGDTAGAVDLVDVKTPVLHVWQNPTDKSWNVTKLFKKQSPDQPMALRSNILIHDGTFRVAPAQGKTAVVEKVNGSVSLADYPSVRGDATGSVDGQDVSLSVHYLSARDYDIKVKGSGLSANFAASYVPVDTGVSLTEGGVGEYFLHIRESHDGLFAEGQADLNHLGFAYGDYRVSDVTGQIRLFDTDLHLNDVHAKVNDQAVAISGLVKINGNVPVFDLKVDAERVDMGALTVGRDVDVSGTAGYHGRLWGTPSDLGLEGKVILNNVTYSGFTVDSAKADVSYIHHVATLQSLEANLYGGTLQADGRWNSESGDIGATLHADSVSVGDMPGVPVGLGAIISGDFIVGGNTNNLNNVVVQGKAQGNGLSYDGIALDGLSTDVHYGNGILQLTGIHGFVGSGTLRGDFAYSFSDKQTDGNLIITGAPLDMFSGLAGADLRGTVSAVVHVSGTEPIWSMDLNAADGAVNGMGFDNIYGNLHGTGRQIVIDDLTYRYKDGSHRASGSINLDSGILDLQIDTQHARLEQVLQATGKDLTGFTGWVNNTVHISGTTDNPSVEGKVILSYGSVKGYLYDYVQADYRMDNGVWELTNGSVSAYDATVHFSGTVGDRLNLDVDGSNLETDRLIHRKDVSLKGALNLQAHVGGTLDNPSVGGSVKGASLVVNDLPLDNISGNFTYGDGILRLHRFGFTQGDGKYEAELMHNGKNGRIIARASVDGGSLENIIKITKAPLTKITGRLDGNISVDGTTDNPNAHIQGQITQGVMDGYVIDPSDIDVTFEAGILQVNKLSLHVDGGLLAAQGSYAVHGPVNIQIAAKNFSTAILQDVTGANSVPVDSRIDFALNMSGTSDNPVAEGSVQLTGGTLNGVPFTDAFALFNVKNGVISLNQASLTRSPYKATASGTIPLAALRDDVSDGPIQVELRLDNAGLDGLAFLTPWVEEAKGAMTGRIVVGGTVQNPQLNGSVTVRNGYAKLKGISNPLDSVNGDLIFNGNSATLESHGTMDKKGKGDKGYYDVKGKAVWEGTTPTDYSLTVGAHGLALDCDYYKGPVDGELTVSKDGDLPLLSGNMDVHDATINIPLALIMSDSDTNAALDITVKAGDKVRFYNSGLYDVWVTGDATFKGTVKSPYATGHFDVTRGSVRYLDTRFQIIQGRAEFKGTSFIPYINLSANTRVGQYAVFLNLTGPADDMDMNFQSDPPLSRTQIISLITLRNADKHDSSLNSDDMNSLLGSGIRFTLNSLGVTQKLEDALSLDMLTVTTGNLDLSAHDSGDDKNYYNIEMGKYLFNNFMLTAAFGLNHNDNRVGMQYNLGSRFSVDAWRSPKNAYVGGSWRYSF